MNLQSTMMQAKLIGKNRGGQSNKAGLPPQLILMELKNRILAALNKLSDRDTQQIALEDLESVAQGLSPDGISLFLSCLYDTDLQQKAVVRRECVKLFGTLASLHGEYLIPHLPRIVSNIVRRLKDPDSAIREVCVDVIGVLAVQVPYPVIASGGDSAGQTPPSVSIGVYMKPLLEALTEQNKGVQLGASLCLARVLDKVENIPVGSVQRLVPRIVKFMSMPGFLAKAGLLTVIGSLAHAVGGSGAAGASLLTSLVPCAQECLDNTDWATRKAAGDTLLRMAMSLGPALSPFKASVVPALEACRFDKVKPVRDSVNDAMALWRNVPGGDVEEPSSAGRNGRAKSSGDQPSVTSSISSPLRAYDSEASNGLRTSRALFPSEVHVPTFPNSALENSAGKKKSPNFGDRKLNPEFFRKLDNLNTDELQIEVCGPPMAQLSSSKEEQEGDIEATARKMHLSGSHITAITQSYSSVEIRQGTEYGDSLSSQPGFNAARDLETLTMDGQSNNQLKNQPYSWPDNNSSDMPNDGHRWEMETPVRNSHSPGNNDFDSRVVTCKGQRWDMDSPLRHSPSPANNDFDSRVASDPSMWTAIRRHLQQIERQQAQLMDMFQDFVASSQEGMSGLEATVQNLERAVEKVAHEVAASAGRVGTDGISRIDLDNNFPDQMQNGTGPNSPDYTIGIEETSLPPDLAGLRSGEKYPKWMVEKGSLILDEYTYGSPLLAGSEGLIASRQQNVLGYTDELQGEISLPGFDSDILSSRRGGWESRESRTPSRSEGGTARSVWKSANDQAKATLAAIRGAGYQGGDPEGIDTDLSKLEMNGLSLYSRAGDR